MEKVMNLKEIRTQLAKVSGRYDLVKDITDYDDNGADFFINAGLRWLEGEVEFSKTFGRYIKDIVYGEHLINMLYSRAIREVWITNSVGKYKLDRKSLTWMQSNYGKDVFSLNAAIGSGESLEVGSRYLITYFKTGDDFTNVGAEENKAGVYFTATDTTPDVWTDSLLRRVSYNISPSVPIYYAPCIIRMSPQTSSNIPPSTYDFGDVMFGHSSSYNSILLMPPPNGLYTLSVIGDFMPAPMIDDDDTNFWSEVYPDLLIQAAMLKIEQCYRNTEGARDMETALKNSLMSIEADSIVGDVHNADTMKRTIDVGYDEGENSNERYSE